MLQLPRVTLLADDHLQFRKIVKWFLEREADIRVLEASDGDEAVRLALERKPDLAILDIGMPVRNGIDAARQIRQVSALTKVIILTVHSDSSYVREALRAGVLGYVLKSAMVHDLMPAIECVSAGRVYLSRSLGSEPAQTAID